MASDDRPKLPRNPDEKLYVEGEKEPYFRDLEHTIRLRVHELTIRRGYQPDHSNPAAPKVLAELLRGKAELERGERLAVVGLKTSPTTPIEFDLEPISDDTETKHHWHVLIWFRPHDSEGGWKSAFCVNGTCTRQYLDDLLAAVRRGHVDNICVDITTTLCTRDRTTWHLIPSPNGPELEHGYISSLTWEEKFDLRDKETAAKPQLVELLPRVYSMLTALLAIAAALLVLTFSRH